MFLLNRRLLLFELGPVTGLLMFLLCRFHFRNGRCTDDPIIMLPYSFPGIQIIFPPSILTFVKSGHKKYKTNR
jgi:hypothetical protein